MAEARGTFDQVLVPVAHGLASLGGYLAADNGADLFTRLGYKLPAGSNLSVLVADVKTAATSLSQIVAAVEKAYASGASADASFLDTLEQLASAIDKLVTIAQDLPTRANTAFASAPDFLASAHIDALPRRFVDYVLVGYLSREYPRTTSILELLGLVTRTFVPESTYNPDFYLHEVHWDRFAQWFSQPSAVMAQEYGWGTPNFADHVLIERLKGLSWLLGLPAEGVGLEDAAQPDAPSQNQLDIPLFSGHVAIEPDGLLGVLVGLRMLRANDPQDAANAGLALVPYADGQFSIVLQIREGWTLAASAGMGVQGLAVLIQPHTGVRIQTSATLSGPVGVTLRRDPNVLGPLVLLGDAAGTRLEAQDVSLGVLAVVSGTRTDFGVEGSLKALALVIVPGDGDNFLKHVLPSGPVKVSFDLVVGANTRNGLYFGTGAGLDETIPLNLTLGPLVVELLRVSLPANSAQHTSLELGATLRLALGPFNAAVQGIGVETRVSTTTHGNLGMAQLDLGFRAPDGVGLAIETGAVVGGGFLAHDASKHQYVGVLQMELGGKIALKAIGLLTTQLPDGSPGYSLVLLITAEGFAPIQLGYGFTLNGIGGLLGVNRAADETALRAGLRQGTLDSILFPVDPVRNAPQIVSDLARVFPAARDRFLLGPMARIGWGTPTLLTIDLAVLLELPDPVRLIALGRLRAVLPDDQHAVVRLQMDALGILDFAHSEASLDATLYDSRLIDFPLTGDMALRAGWGSSPHFVLAVGGLNPRFPMPAGFPRLERVALSLANTANLRVRMDAYLALTSNTVQFGAHLELMARVDPFSLEGHIGFDALFQFSPFQLVADLSASVALKAGTQVLMAVGLVAVLTGPTPWHIQGWATFQILFFKASVRFDQTFGPAQAPPLPRPVDVEALLVAALADTRNWSSELAADEHPLVTLRDTRGAQDVRAHPLALLNLRERVVPLDWPITRFGTARPSGARQFHVSASTASGPSLPSPDILTDAFARAQFIDMSDDEKLTAPAFDQLPSGVRFGSEAVVYPEALVLESAITFDTVVSDPVLPSPPPAALRTMLGVGAAEVQISHGAAAQASIRASGPNRYQPRARQHARSATRR